VRLDEGLEAAADLDARAGEVGLVERVEPREAAAVGELQAGQQAVDEAAVLGLVNFMAQYGLLGNDPTANRIV